MSIPTKPLSLTVNGKSVGPIDVPESTPMVDFLHEYLNLTGTRLGCGIGECRACAVISDGADGSQEIRTCITGAHFFAGKKVRTIEGIGAASQAPTGKEAATPAASPQGGARKVIPISPVQQKYLEHFSFQCGYCTPGFVVAATVLLEKLAKKPIAVAAVEDTITEALSPHLCRCTGYVRYFAAVKDVILHTPGYTTKG
ncbi:2Fe-2S iron-sulfur cluster-binding protein [Diaphorobacter sp.]|uniref:(2Fe-2S)-binding protein n=1 Tax=Diaphorobacter sp. TaxID=1934310 RepID=UPI0028AD350D|nr:2Fe-2S iron-sulfur cluster-binding protein [Diaphorobacter sp.]